MAVELRQPYGPGVPEQPGVPAPAPTPTPTASPPPVGAPGSPLAGPPAPAPVGSWDWLREHRLPVEAVGATLNPAGPGTLTGPDSYEWSRLKMTPNATVPRTRLWPALATSAVPGPTAISGPEQEPRLGQLQADMFEPWNTLDQFAANFLGSGNETVGTDLFASLNARDIDFLSFNAPSRIADYAIALPMTAVGWALGNPGAFAAWAGGGQEDRDFPFQEHPGYWDWVAKATDEDFVEQARTLAMQYSAGRQSQVVFDALLSQFRLDQAKTTGFTSGDRRFDWIAQFMTYDQWGGIEMQRPELAADEAARQRWLDEETARFMEIGKRYGLEDTPEAVRNFLETGNRDFIYSPLEQLSLSAVGWFPAQMVPFIGSDIAYGLVAEDPFRDTMWDWVGPQVRAERLAGAGMTSMIYDLGSTIAAALIASPYIAAGAAASQLGTANLAARVYQGYNLVLNVSKVGLGAGLTSMVANLAAEAAIPGYEEAFGQYVDYARPMSNSYLAGVWNGVGLVSTGTYGLVPMLQVGGRAGRRVVTAGKVALGEREPMAVVGVWGHAATTGQTLERFGGVSLDVQSNGIKNTLMSYVVNGEQTTQLRQFNAALRDMAVGGTGNVGHPVLDRLGTAAEKLAYIEDQLAYLDVSAHARAETFLKLMARARRELSLSEKLGWSRDGEAVLKANKDIIRTARAADDALARSILDDYRFRFGPDPDAIREGVIASLKRLHKNHPDLVNGQLDEIGLTRKVGGDLQEWQRLAMRVNSLEFTIEHGALYHVAQGTDEAATLHLQLKSTLTKQDVTPDLLALLRSGGPDATAAFEQLRDRFPQVQRWIVDSKGTMGPNELADWLEAMEPVLSNRRLLPAPGSATESLPLNQFHARLEAEGPWTLAYKPYVDETPAGLNRAAWRDDELFAPMLDDLTIPLILATQPPPGYRRVVPGEHFVRSLRRFLRTATDGVYVNEVPGEVPPTPTTAAAPGQPVGPSVATPGGGSYGSYPADQLANWFDGYDDAGNLIEAPDAFTMTETGTSLHGQNAGATWPVFLDANGTKWMFKARRGHAGLSTLSGYRRAAGVAATKMYNYLGLKSGVELEWVLPSGTLGNASGQNIHGTIQPVFEGLTPLDVSVNGLRNLSQDQLDELAKHHLVDWWLGQHDTNATSLFTDMNGRIVAVDKGQAFKFYGHPDEWPPSLEFLPPDKANDRLDDFFKKAHAAGVRFDRGAIEDTLQKIEALSDQQITDWVDPVVTTRLQAVAMNQVPPYWDDTWGQWPADEVTQMVLDRRNTLRDAFNQLYTNQLDSGPIWAPHSRFQYFGRGKNVTYWVGQSPDPVNGSPPWDRTTLGQYQAYYEDPGHGLLVQQPDTAGIHAAGVLIVEDDGRLWVHQPRNKYTGELHYAGYKYQLPKGRVDPGEHPQFTAMREMNEEMGMDVIIDGHLIDFDDNGKVTRFYYGHRVGGGPRWAGDETGYGYLGTPDWARAHLRQKLDGSDNLRDIAVLDAYVNHLQGGTTPQQAQAVSPLIAGSTGGTGPAPAVAGATGNQVPRRFVTYAKMPDGSVVRAPWVEYGMFDASGLSIGNRGYVGAKLDALFRGFRSWRITDMQEAALYRRMATQYAGINETNIRIFADRVSDMALDYQLQVQTIGVLSDPYVFQHIPILKDIRHGLADIAEDVFGKNLVDKGTGTVIPTRRVAWHRIIGTSYRQSLTHNLSAGFTSWVYSLPGGWTAALLGQVVWPMFKYRISPLFKVGEWAESWLFNKLRGIWGRSPESMRLRYDAGLGGISAHKAESLENRIVNMSSFNALGPRARPGRALFILSDRTTPTGMAQAEVARAAQAGPLRPPPVTVEGIDAFETGPFLGSQPDLFPATLPEDSAEYFRRFLTTETGEQATSLVVPAWDERAVTRAREKAAASGARPDRITESILRTDEDAALAAQAIANVEQFGFANIDRLLEALPIVHSPGRHWWSRMDVNGDVAAPGLVPTGGTELDVTTTGALRPTRHVSSPITESEQWLGMQDSKYSLWGYRSTWGDGVDEQTIANHPGDYVTMVPKKSRVLGRDLITDGDRANQVWEFHRHTMSPHAALRIYREELVSQLMQMTPEQSYDDVLDGLLQALENSPEHAIYGGFMWDDLEALIFADQQGLDRFQQMIANVPADKPVHRVELRLRKPQQTSTWGRNAWVESIKDYAWEKAGLVDYKDAKPLVHTSSHMAQVDPMRVEGDAAKKMWRSVEEALESEAGFSIDADPKVSFLDSIVDSLEAARRDYDYAQETLQKVATGYDRMPHQTPQQYISEMAAIRSRMDDMLQLHADVVAYAEAHPMLAKTIHEATEMQRDVALRVPQEAAEVWAIVRDPALDVDDLVAAVDTVPVPQGVDRMEWAIFKQAAIDEQVMRYFAERAVTLNMTSSPLLAQRPFLDSMLGAGKVAGPSAQMPWVSLPRLDPHELMAGYTVDQMRAAQKLRGVMREYADELPKSYPRADSVLQGASPGIGQSYALKQFTLTQEFDHRIHDLMMQRLGYDPGRPVIRMYLRGSGSSLSFKSTIDDPAELVITVSAADRSDTRLLAHEVMDIWSDTHGAPFRDTGGGTSETWWWWDPDRRKLAYGEVGAEEPTPMTLPDGTTTYQLRDDYENVIDVVVRDRFDSLGQSYATFERNSGLLYRANAVEEKVIGPHSKRFVKHGVAGPTRGRQDTWSYAVEADQSIIQLSNSPRLSLLERVARFRDVFARYGGDGKGQWRLEVELPEDIDALGQLWYLRELPDNIVVFDTSTMAVVDDNAMRVKFGAPDDILRQRPIFGLEGLPGSDEQVMARWAAMLERQDAAAVEGQQLFTSAMDGQAADDLIEETGRARRLIGKVMNPMPYKEGQMELEAAQIADRMFGPVLRDIESPAYLVYNSLGVPDDDIVEFIFRDRALLANFLETGNRADLDRLIAHSEKYRPGIGDKPARQAIDELYMSEDWQTLVQVWRWVLKAAHDEAFTTHFYNPYRSWVERSINHPVFGIYPLSWSLKAAREWALFLFDNRILGKGHFRLGMAPATIMAEYNRMLSELAARDDIDMEQVLSIEGGLGASFMIFGLIMPGDWSSIPFPASRSIRDYIRGNANIGDHLLNNLSSGIVRDARLAQESWDELSGMAAQWAGYGTPEEPPNWYQLQRAANPTTRIEPRSWRSELSRAD